MQNPGSMFSSPKANATTNSSPCITASPLPPLSINTRIARNELLGPTRPQGFEKRPATPQKPGQRQLAGNCQDHHGGADGSHDGHLAPGKTLVVEQEHRRNGGHPGGRCAQDRRWRPRKTSNWPTDFFTGTSKEGSMILVLISIGSRSFRNVPIILVVF